MKTIQKIFVALFLAATIQSSFAGVNLNWHPITTCSSLTFTPVTGGTPIIIPKPAGNNPWNFSQLPSTGSFTVTDCNNNTLGTANTGTGIFTPTP